MNLKKKFVIGAASVALVASMGGVAAPAAFATPSLPGSLTLRAPTGNALQLAANDVTCTITQSADGRADGNAHDEAGHPAAVQYQP